MDPAMYQCPIQRLEMTMVLFKSEPKCMMPVYATRAFMDIKIKYTEKVDTV